MKVSNPQKLLRHGETGNILLPLPYKQAMIVPQKATFEILDKKYVYVVNDKNELEQKQIVVAGELPHIFIVKEGLNVTDKILLEGLRKVRNGQEIEVEFQAPEVAFAKLDLHAE